jgi:hypothetical protein
MKVFKWLDDYFYNISRKDVDTYLSGATDLQDLETRQRLIERGQAPFQIISGYRSRSMLGW